MPERDPHPEERGGGRAERSRARRASARADKLVFALLLAAAIGACLLFVSTLEIRSEKVLAGWIVASVAVPTAVLLALHDRIRRLLP